jgi:hypothetical protein
MAGKGGTKKMAGTIFGDEHCVAKIMAGNLKLHVNV